MLLPGGRAADACAEDATGGLNVPYFLYKIHQRGGLSALEYIACYDAFKEARLQERRLRAQLADEGEGSDCVVKMVFAADEVEAADLLSEKREAPVLREWEK